MQYNDFNLMYDSITMGNGSIPIRKTLIALNILDCLKMKYPDTGDESINRKFDYLYDKALAVQQKAIMMMFAGYNFRNAKHNFEITQNMEFPVLFGVEKTSLLFYIESMIVFARNALDVAAALYSDLLFDKRTDSFNDFSKKLMSSDNPQFEELKRYFEDIREDGLSAYRLLCGSEKGRALRDIIIHQANVNLEYYEYKEGSEKEHLFLIIKDYAPIDVDWFISVFIDEVEEIFNKTTACCENYLTSLNNTTSS